MNQNEQIIFDFYTAFQNLDAEKMATLYANNVTFEDPAFGVLKGEDAKNMWRMLCKNSQDLKLTFSILESSENIVHAHWNALYTFSKTQRHVNNSINATFILENGKIIRHTDKFNLWKWSQQALGLSGYLLGWSPLFKKKLHQTTRNMLHKFSAKP